MAENPLISVVTPTLRRPDEVAGLLANLAAQTTRPDEVILVDGAPPGIDDTEKRVAAVLADMPFFIRYIRHGGGTAIQRNAGLDAARGRFILFADDDVRLEPDFLAVMLAAMKADGAGEIGGIAGYRTNKYFAPESVMRWRWYRRLRLLSVFEPGRYDFQCGYPINANMQPPFSGTRGVDFMTTACAFWRAEVFAGGLRFDPFFRDYGVLEDAHLSLRARKRWRLLQAGEARCVELSSPRGREPHRKIGYKCVVNYYYVFRDMAGPLSLGQRFRFWRVQVFDLLRILASAVRRLRAADLWHVLGKLQGFAAVATGAVSRALARRDQA